MSKPVQIMWFRRDLRVADNPALTAAAANGEPVLPLFIAAAHSDDPWAPAAVSLRRRDSALAQLAKNLEGRGSRLILRAGEPGQVIAKLLGEMPVAGVFWNRRHEPYERRIEAALIDQLGRAKVPAQRFDGGLLFAPERIRTTTGKPYRVFGPFWRACLRMSASLPGETPLPTLTPLPGWPRSERLPRSDAAATADDVNLDRHVATFLADYPELRDRPDRDGTSLLSAPLHFGEIGPRQLWLSVTQANGRASAPSERVSAAAAETFLRQLAWREFAYHLLHHFPETTDAPMRPQFARFPWNDDEAGLERWQRGETGYPLVDAGMRQLAGTGWMHNRVRMVAASFLIKHLLIDWRHGARHFWAALADADLANNSLGWQWVAGCGADAAPYFRIFNPVLQGQKFDPTGEYVRAWVPEIAALPDRWIHRPWQAPGSVLADCGLRLGKSYPQPVVDHDQARQRALQAYERTRKH